MPFIIKDDYLLYKYNEIWDKIKETLNTKVHSMPVYDEKYIKAKVREFNGVIKTNFLGNKIPKESMHYTCIACRTIDCYENGKEKLSARLFRRMQTQNEKKTNKMTKFVEAELESGSDSGLESDIESELKSDTE